MKTLLLPTTVGVNESISIKEALSILKSNGITFEVVGGTIDGMYVSENGEIVSEQILPITSTMSADSLAKMFTQECILESDGSSAKLVAQNGDVWVNFTEKIEYNVYNIEDAVKIQEKLARHFGGASRVDDLVWAWGDNDSISSWGNQ